MRHGPHLQKWKTLIFLHFGHGPITRTMGFMKRFCEFCTKIRIVGAEIASTAVFLAFLYVAARYEITHLLRK